MNDLILGITFGVYGYMIANVLTDDGEMLSFVRQAFNKLTKSYMVQWYEKPIYACAKCVAFWHYLIFSLVFDSFSVVSIIIATFVGHYLSER